MITRLLIPICLALGACASTAVQDTPTRAIIADSSLPPMKNFGSANPQRPNRSNTEIANDFLDLSFQLESGRDLPAFTRFETPISVRVTGNAPPSLGPDLARLLSRLRNEAGINISKNQSATAHITIEAVSRAEIRRALPQAACFVVPNVTSLAEYRSKKRSPETNWALLQARRKMAIFLPYDASPQEIRDCLHEELAQAIGPLNDLYRLNDSVFNDDNIHTVLTGFDMLILRTTYSRELQNGMTREQVAARLPAILSRTNPSGRGGGSAPSRPTTRDWVDAIQTALGPGTSRNGRQRAINNAVKIAQNQGWQDNRLGFSHYVAGRLTQRSDAVRAFEHFVTADRVYARLPNSDLHRAYIATQIAAYAISDGNGEVALRIIDPNIPIASRYENAAMLATLMLMRAEALDLLGRSEAARSARVDSIGWARYGFGEDWAVRAKINEIAQINPQNRKDG
ncbi:MAG: DUF2927 domain-containing protein [Paracoccaceae bacterium]